MQMADRSKTVSYRLSTSAKYSTQRFQKFQTKVLLPWLKAHDWFISLCIRRHPGIVLLEGCYDKQCHLRTVVPFKNKIWQDEFYLESGISTKN